MYTSSIECPLTDYLCYFMMQTYEINKHCYSDDFVQISIVSSEYLNFIIFGKAVFTKQQCQGLFVRLVRFIHVMCSLFLSVNIEKIAFPIIRSIHYYKTLSLFKGLTLVIVFLYMIYCIKNNLSNLLQII